VSRHIEAAVLHKSQSWDNHCRYSPPLGKGSRGKKKKERNNFSSNKRIE
jgi:hypothetical protein